jgi:Na+/H+ antiporter NhaD/arsenite permease-like protein
MIPLIVSLTKGMGLDPKYFVIGVILFANIGGNLTLIGDPTNILIGTAAGLSFNDFIVNLYQPISLVTVFVLISLAILHWQDLRPVSGNLKKLFLSHLMIQKIELQYAKVHFKRRFIVKSIAVFLLTILGFVLQTHLGVPIYVLALSGAALLMLLTQGDSKVHQILQEVEWKTLLFFAGLFVMVGGLQEVGVLNVVANAFLLLSDNFLLLLLTVLWVSAIISMVLDNVPFVVIMIPVITQLQGVLEQGDPNMLWWALSLGAILGGCGTLVGSSANLVSANIASKHGVEISFLEYMRTALPLTIGMLILCSCYFYFLLG